jgi:hypothetical protein
MTNDDARFPSHVCAVCGRVLERISNDEGEHVGWVHPYTMRIGSLGEMEDHQPVPVPATDLPFPDTRCDFCYAINPQWILPANDFVNVDGIRDLSMPGQPEVASAGDWAACDECADLLKIGMWSGLVKRAIGSYERRVLNGGKMDSFTEGHLRRQYKELRKNVRGAVYRMEKK